MCHLFVLLGEQILTQKFSQYFACIFLVKIYMVTSRCKVGLGENLVFLISIEE